MNKYLLLFYLSIVGMSFRQSAMAQSADLAAYVSEVTIPSAGTAGLMKFTDVPVSYYTGTPDISVPIYTINTGKLSLPITLRYSGAANRVADNSSNVGLGWTLSAEGVLQESVLGIPDNNTYHQYGLNWEGGMLNPSSQTHQQLLESLVTGGLDGVPDLYTFSFPGGSGKFIYADVIRTLPQQNLAITTYINGTEPDWKIVTQDGTQYYFEIMEKISNRASSSVTRSRAWYLTKMVDANNTDSILLSYEPTMITESIGRSYNFTTWRPNAPVLAPFDVDMAPNDPPIPGQFDQIEQMTHGWQLKTITWNQGSINYDIAWNDRQDMAAGNSEGGLPRIRNIFLKNKEGATIRVINFKHAYFQTPGEDNVNGKRLKLEAVTFASSVANLSTPEAYKYAFEYDPMPLPSKLSNAVDHWGFYNGAITNASKGLIPTISYPGFNYYGANREANPAYGKAAMLTKMYYPTGGYAAFTWEGHAKTYPPQFDSVIVYTDTVISMALACVGNEEITAEWEDRITIPTTPTDLFGNGVQATWYCSMGTSGQNTMLTVNHAGGAGWLLERPAIQPAAVPVTTTSKSFPYSPTGNYHHQQNVTLQPGKMYSIKGHINHPGFSLDVSLEAKWPKKIWTSTTQPSEFVGGMRIKKIEMFDTVTRKSIVRNYQYAQPSFAAKPRYYTPLVRYYYNNGGNPPQGSSTDCMYYQTSEGLFVSSSSVYNVNGGVQAGYNWVKETIGDGQDGYTTYYFNNFSDGTFLGEVPATWRFGRLERKSEYAPSGTEIRRTTYSNKTILTSAEDFAGHTAQQIASHPCYSPGGVYGANYTQKAYRFPCDWLYTDTVKTDDLQTGLSTLSISNYDNAQHRELTRSTTFFSDGTKQTSFIKYPTDFSFSNSPSGDAAAIARMQEKHMHNIAIEQYVQRWTPGSSQAMTLAAGYNQFKLADGAGNVVPAAVHKMDIAIPLTNFQPATGSTNVIAKDSRYIPKTWIEEQDSRYNPLTLASDGNDNAGYIWGYGNTLPIAKVKNDSTNRYRAFTSFEQDATGNWNYNENSVTLSDRLTGKRAFQLTPSNDVSIMVSVAIGGTQAAPPIAGNYILSYWRKGGTSMVNGSTPIVAGTTSNGWTYCEHRLPNPNGVLTLSGTAMIDELRFYKQGALMESFSYDPLIGITSADNAAGQLVFYEYDAMGRLSLEKDVFGKILKKYTYQYSGQ